MFMCINTYKQNNRRTYTQKTDRHIYIDTHIYIHTCTHTQTHKQSYIHIRPDNKHIFNDK